MRTKFRVALAAVAVGALTVATAAPAGAQEEPETLGFAVDKTQAQPGALVLGKADVADVQEHCTTTVEEFQARFQELLEGPFAGGASEGELFDRFFPTGDFDFENFDQLAYSFTGLIIIGLVGFAGPEAAEDALPQTFVMTFADIATQEPVGELSNFDPNTGEGSVVVPDIEPGLWAVAAACVGPSLDIDFLEAGIRANGDFLEEIGFPEPTGDLGNPDIEAFMQEFLDSEATGFDLLIEFLTAIGPDFVENIVTPDAFGAVIFCILDEQGNCPADEEPAPPPGEPIDVAPEAPAPAQPVVAAPTFTG